MKRDFCFHLFPLSEMPVFGRHKSEITEIRLDDFLNPLSELSLSPLSALSGVSGTFSLTTHLQPTYNPLTDNL